MGGPEEKPLVRVAGVGMLERVVAAIKGSAGISQVLVACSPHAPETERRARALGLRTVKTSGKGYVEDMREAAAKARTPTLVVISADLPLISTRLIDMAVERYMDAGRPALTTVARSPHGGSLAPVGLNVLDREALLSGRQLSEETLVVEGEPDLINVNTREEVDTAERAIAGGAPAKRRRLPAGPA
jgi:GTP:adenosylcobinamide-phosphate guanylyltransferase